MFRNEFIEACRTGDMDIIETILNNVSGDTDIESIKTQAYVTAYSNGNRKISDLLLEKFDINFSDTNIGLECFIDDNDLESIKYIINQKGDNIDFMSIVNYLLYACVNGKLDIVKYFIEEFNIDINSHSTFENFMKTPIEEAIRSNNIGLVKYLVGNGADIHLHEEDIFITTIRYSNIDMLKYLVDECNLNIKRIDYKFANRIDRGAIGFVSSYQKSDIVRYLLEEHGLEIIDNKGILLYFIHDFHMVKYLIEGYNVRITEDALVLATSRIEVFKYLLDMVEDININYYDNVLPAAIKNNEPECIRLLVDKGVTIDHYSIMSALVLTAPNAVRLMEYFGDHGADYHTHDYIYLESAVRTGSLEKVKYLVEEQGLDVSINNNSPLNIACEHGYLDIVKYLVAHGASIYDGPVKYAPMKRALAIDNIDILEYLIDVHKEIKKNERQN